MTARVQLIGGPADGVEYEVPNDPPWTIHVAQPPPLTFSDIAAADGPTVPHPDYTVHVYERPADVPDPGRPWRYQYAGTRP